MSTTRDAHRLLVVDDERRVLDGLENLLFVKAPAWEATLVADPAEATALLDHQPFGALLTDMRMPGMDGSLVLEHARRVQPETIRISLTGEVDLAMAKLAVPCSHRFLSKPCPSARLLATLDWAAAVVDPHDRSSALAFAGGLTGFPALPATAATVGDLVAAGGPLDEIVEVISADLGATISVLRWANSGYVDCQPTSSIRTAAGRLRAHWLHVAVAAAPIATSEAAQARLGVINERATRVAQAATSTNADLSLALRVRSLAADLREVTGAAAALPDHELSALLLSLWDLPEVVVRAVGSQHQPGALRGPAADIATRLHQLHQLGDAEART